MVYDDLNITHHWGGKGRSFRRNLGDPPECIPDEGFLVMSWSKIVVSWVTFTRMISVKDIYIVLNIRITSYHTWEYMDSFPLPSL